MRYLLDTCTVSDYFRRQGRVAERMHAVAPHELAVSTVTEHEVWFGLEARPNQRLATQVTRLLGVLQVLPFDRDDAREAAEVRAALRAKGTPIGDFDGLLAGVALARGLVLVTANEREFSRVKGLAVENWR